MIFCNFFFRFLLALRVKCDYVFPLSNAGVQFSRLFILDRYFQMFRVVHCVDIYC